MEVMEGFQVGHALVRFSFKEVREVTVRGLQRRGRKRRIISNSPCERGRGLIEGWGNGKGKNTCGIIIWEVELVGFQTIDGECS